MKFQILQHELKLVFIGSNTSQVSEDNWYYASVLGFSFSATQKEGICMIEANCDKSDKNVIHVTLLFRLFLLNCIFSTQLVQSCWQVLFENR